MEFSHIVYIDGVKHRTTGITGRFFADSPEMPCRPCSQHDVGRITLSHHATVVTSGRRYCLSPKSKSIPLNKFLTEANKTRHTWPETAPWHRRVKAFLVGMSEAMGINHKWRSKSAAEDRAYVVGSQIINNILHITGAR